MTGIYRESINVVDMRKFSVAVVSLLLSLCALAKSPADTVRILAVGNSFSVLCEIYGLQPVTASDPYPFPVCGIAPVNKCRQDGTVVEISHRTGGSSGVIPVGGHVSFELYIEQAAVGPYPQPCLPVLQNEVDLVRFVEDTAYTDMFPMREHPFHVISGQYVYTSGSSK